MKAPITIEIVEYAALNDVAEASKNLLGMVEWLGLTLPTADLKPKAVRAITDMKSKLYKLSEIQRQS